MRPLTVELKQDMKSLSTKKNGKYKHIAGIKKSIRVFSMDQITLELNMLVKKPSGIYLMLTCYIPKREDSENTEMEPEAPSSSVNEGWNGSRFYPFDIHT